MPAAFDDSDETVLGGEGRGSLAETLRLLFAEMRTHGQALKEMKRRLFEGFAGAPPELKSIRDSIDKKVDQDDFERLCTKVDGHEKEIQDARVYQAKFLTILSILWMIAQTLITIAVQQWASGGFKH